MLNEVKRRGLAVALAAAERADAEAEGRDEVCTGLYIQCRAFFVSIGALTESSQPEEPVWASSSCNRMCTIATVDVSTLRPPKYSSI